MKTNGKEKSLKIPIFEKIQHFFKIVQNLNCTYRGLQKPKEVEKALGWVLITMQSHYNGFLPLDMFIS